MVCAAVEDGFEAVRLIRERGVAYAQASRDLGVHQTVLRNWVKAFADDPAQAFPGNGRQSPEQAEITRLKREVAKLKPVFYSALSQPFDRAR